MQSGKIYVFDKAYLDFNWWHKIHENNSCFVTRIKKNTAYKVLQEHEISNCDSNIISDKTIVLTNKFPGGKRKNLLAGKTLRLVEVYDREHNKTYYFITNMLNKTTYLIALMYKTRWQIELLFKWLKQNFKLTTFLGETQNAIKTQIYDAIITYIMIGIFKTLHQCSFQRNIDLLSWLQISIFASSVILKPPEQHKNPNIFFAFLNHFKRYFMAQSMH